MAIKISAKGAREFDKFASGKSLTTKEAILAKCYDCACSYTDGKIDCMIDTCPLYQFMPYGEKWLNREKPILSQKQKDNLHKLNPKIKAYPRASQYGAD